MYDRLGMYDQDPSDQALQMVNGYSGAFQPNSNLDPYQNAFSGQFQFVGQGQVLSSFFVSEFFISARSQMYSSGNLGSHYLKVGDETTINNVKYKILKELGAGAYGSVFLAEDLQSRKKVAIKVPKVVSGDHNNVVGKEAQHEIGMLELMLHNNFAVKMLNHDISGERPKIVIEYTPYGSLRDQLGKAKRTIGQRISCAFKLMKDAAVGLVPMKIVGNGADMDEVFMEVRHDMAHGDVKPDNFLVFKSGGSVVFKTGDWGSAHLVTDTTWDELKGTPLYMAPEVLGGLCNNTLCDVWSTAMSAIDIIHDQTNLFDTCKMLGLDSSCFSQIDIHRATKIWTEMTEQKRMAQIQTHVFGGQPEHKQIPSLEWYLCWMLRPALSGQFARATWEDVMNIPNEWTKECTPELFPEG